MRAAPKTAKINYRGINFKPVRPPKQNRPWTQPRCPYCGRKIRDGCDACSAHDDLPLIDPLAPLGKS